MPSINSSVAARILAEKVGIFDFKFQQELSLILAAEATASGQALEAVINRALLAWRTYCDNRLAFQWAYPSAIGFFRSAIWNDDKLWPWKSERAAIGSTRGTAGHSDACDYGRHRFCDQEWCRCSCHTEKPHSL